MSFDRLVEELQTMPGFNDLAEKDLARLIPLLDEIEFPAGRVLMRQGSYRCEAFLVVSGTASVEADGQVLGRAGVGDILGEVSLLAGGPRTATVTAETDMTVLAIGPTSFKKFIASPGVAVVLARQLASRLRAAGERQDPAV